MVPAGWIEEAHAFLARRGVRLATPPEPLGSFGGVIRIVVEDAELVSRAVEQWNSQSEHDG